MSAPYGPGNPDPARVEAYRQEVARMLDEGDFMIQAVFGDTEAFAYTVGLTGRGLPELWCSAGPQTSSAVLNVAGAFLLSAGGPLTPGTDLRVPDLSVPLRFTGLCDPQAAEVGLAQMMHPLTPVQVVQVLWPDDAGHWPGEAWYDSDKFPQRLLPGLL